MKKSISIIAAAGIAVAAGWWYGLSTTPTNDVAGEGPNGQRIAQAPVAKAHATGIKNPVDCIQQWMALACMPVAEMPGIGEWARPIAAKGRFLCPLSNRPKSS